MNTIQIPIESASRMWGGIHYHKRPTKEQVEREMYLARMLQPMTSEQISGMANIPRQCWENPLFGTLFAPPQTFPPVAN
jgi:hypothetical protein